MIYGYARCSGRENLHLQDISRQFRELEKLGVNKENIFAEYESGMKTDRIQLNKLLNICKKFISVEEDIKWICLFKVLYYCGHRRGELRGLTWKNINFEKRTLSVVQNVVNVSGDRGYWQITTPKTRTSTRTIPIPEKVCEDLIEYKKECKRYYGFNDKWFVFGDVDPLHPDVLRRKKNDNAEKAGVKQIRIHDFRYSCASLLINNGANVTMVAKYLGHAKIEETLNTYSHIFQNKLDDIVNAILFSITQGYISLLKVS